MTEKWGEDGFYVRKYLIFFLNVDLYIWNPKNTENLAGMLSTLDSYSGDHGFEIRAGYRLTRLKFSTVHRRKFKVVHDFFVSCKCVLIFTFVTCSRTVIRLYCPVMCEIEINVRMEQFNTGPSSRAV